MFGKFGIVVIVWLLCIMFEGGWLICVIVLLFINFIVIVSCIWLFICGECFYVLNMFLVSSLKKGLNICVGYIFLMYWMYKFWVCKIIIKLILISGVLIIFVFKMIDFVSLLNFK